MSTGVPPDDDGTPRGPGRRDRRESEGSRTPQPAGDPIARRAPSDGGPTSATLEVVRGRLPLSIRLIGRSSVPGAVLLVALAVVFVGLVPLLAKLQLNAQQATGETIPIGNALELTVANDWAVESQDGQATVLSSGSAQLVIVPAYEATLTPAEAIEAEAATIAADDQVPWVVAEPTAVSTDQGARGATVSASSDTAATQVWVIESGGLTTTAVLTSTIESWATALDGAERMIDSMVFSPDEEDAP